MGDGKTSVVLLLGVEGVKQVKDACQLCRSANVEPQAIELSDKVFVEDRVWGGWRYRLENKVRYAPPKDPYTR